MTDAELMAEMDELARTFRIEACIYWQDGSICEWRK